MQLGKLLAGSYYNKPHPIADAGVAARLREAVRNEPLQLDSLPFLEYAKAKNLNLAVLANDGLMGRFLSGKLTHRSFVTRNKPFMKTEVKEGWVCMQPSSPVEARLQRDDRSSIEALLKSSDMNIESRGRYLKGRPFSYGNGLGARLACALFENTIQTDFTSDEDIQRLYASMLPVQRRDRQIAFGAMTADQKVVANRLVYSQPGQYADNDEYTWHNEESTVLFAGSLGADHVFTVDEVSSPTILSYYSGAENRLFTVELQIYQPALEWFWEQNPQYVKTEAKFKASQFIPANRRTIKLSLSAEPGLRWFSETSEVDGIGKPTHPKDLPEKHQRAMKVLLGEFDQMVKQGHPPIKDASNTLPIRSNPPPPRR